MVVCKYFQQGNCRYGQYCRFEHTNNFGGQSDRGKLYTENKSIVLGVAEEALAAERGGQWLLSCFGPIKEQACIPGMDDVSPEEVAWEMYQAEKNGTADQTKLQFQQLCQAMTAKRDALKNPTHETAAMLEKLQKGSKDTESFASSTPFGGTNNFTSPISSSTSSSSIFNRPTTNNSSVFGAKPAFGGAAVFGAQAQPSNSIFGGGNETTASVFGGQHAMPTFGTSGQPTSSLFGGGTTNSSSVFGQTTTFGGTPQSNGIFSSTGGNTTSTNSPFSSTQTSTFGGQTSGTLFGGATTITPANSIFGSSQATQPVSSASIFGQPKTSTAFGSAPVFGGTAAFGANQPAPTFGAQPIFSSTDNNVFGSNTTTSTFGSAPGGTNSFAALASTPQNVFQTPQNSTQNTSSPFGNIVSSTQSVGANPFGAAQQNSSGFGAFGAAGNNSTPFSMASTTPFGPMTTSGNDAANPAFGFSGGNTNQGYGAPPAYASTPSTPFASTTTTPSISNPFAQKTQLMTSSSGVTASGTTFGGMSTGPFGQSPFGNPVDINIDKNVYSADSELTDEEKQMYNMSDQFILGKIPTKPPTVELR